MLSISISTFQTHNPRFFVKKHTDYPPGCPFLSALSNPTTTDSCEKAYKTIHNCCTFLSALSKPTTTDSCGKAYQLSTPIHFCQHSPKETQQPQILVKRHIKLFTLLSISIGFLQTPIHKFLSKGIQIIHTIVHFYQHSPKAAQAQVLGSCEKYTNYPQRGPFLSTFFKRKAPQVQILVETQLSTLQSILSAFFKSTSTGFCRKPYKLFPLQLHIPIFLTTTRTKTHKHRFNIPLQAEGQISRPWCRYIIVQYVHIQTAYTLFLRQT
jgi:hypothetical protein